MYAKGNVSSKHRSLCQMCVAAAAKSLQLCLTLCNPMDFSLPGSSIHGIFQAGVLEWGAIAFSECVLNVLNLAFLPHQSAWKNWGVWSSPMA